MDEFIENFNEFREFLNNLTPMAGQDAIKVIRDKFDELGLNNAF